MNLLRSRLREFKLSGMNQSLEERLSYAQEKQLSYTEFLELLLEDESNTRRANSYKKRYTKAKWLNVDLWGKRSCITVFN